MKLTRKEIAALSNAVKSLASKVKSSFKSSDSNSDLAKGIENLNLSTKIIGEYARKQGINKSSTKEIDGEKIGRKLYHAFTNTAEGVSNKFKLLTDNIDDISGKFTETFIRPLPIVGGALDVFYKETTKLTGRFVDNWRSLSDYGQGYGNSMLSLAQNAAAAGISLESYNKLVVKNSDIISQVGSMQFAQLSKNVRSASYAFGMYGHTVDGLNDITSSYMSRLAIGGNLETINQITTKKAVGEIGQLAQQTSALSIAFGKSRDEIMKTTDAAYSNLSFKSRMAAMSADQRMQFLKDHKEINLAAGLPGSAGSMMSDMFAEAAGKAGMNSLNWNTNWLSANNVGLGGPLKGIIAETKANMAAGMDQFDALRLMTKRLSAMKTPELMENLMNQARAGNADAARMIEFFSSVSEITAEKADQMKRATENTKGWTKMFATLDGRIGDVQGQIKGAFFNLIDKAFGGNSGLPDRFQKFFDSTFGYFDTTKNKFIDGSFQKYFSEERIAKWAGPLSKLFDSLTTSLGNGMDSLGKYISDLSQNDSPFTKIFYDTGAALVDFMKNTVGPMIAKGVAYMFSDVIIPTITSSPWFIALAGFAIAGQLGSIVSGLSALMTIVGAIAGVASWPVVAFVAGVAALGGLVAWFAKKAPHDQAKFNTPEGEKMSVPFFDGFGIIPNSTPTDDKKDQQIQSKPDLPAAPQPVITTAGIVDAGDLSARLTSSKSSERDAITQLMAISNILKTQTETFASQFNAMLEYDRRLADKLAPTVFGR